MRNVTFKDGQKMDWPLYRELMLGKLSPQAAVARSRREPAGAYDAALPRRQARDQNGGRLDGPYVRATAEYLRAAGLAQEDLDAIGKILDRYVDEAEPAEDSEQLRATKPLRDPATGLELPEEETIKVGGQRNRVGGAQDRRRFALDELDQYGRARNNPVTAMPLGGDDRGFSRRFPGAERIRTV
jgi:hypothetical protein